MIKKNIYFAGPLFNDAERTFNEQLTKKLRAMGFDVFLPQENVSEIPGYTDIKTVYPALEIFRRDEAAVVKSDILLFILDGRIPDEGACVELGMAYMHKKFARPDRLIIGLKTDARVAFAASHLNAMIQAPLEFVATTQEELLSYLSPFVQASAQSSRIGNTPL
jgi:nucleoside 2-deoxyribosyltransferase